MDPPRDRVPRGLSEPCTTPAGVRRLCAARGGRRPPSPGASGRTGSPGLSADSRRTAPPGHRLPLLHVLVFFDQIDRFASLLWCTEVSDFEGERGTSIKQNVRPFRPAQAATTEKLRTGMQHRADAIVQHEQAVLAGSTGTQ